MENKMNTLEDLVRIIRILRSENGCPWDRVQTHASIRMDMLEEAYEAADAIDKKDMKNLCEELGDVLMQVVFHAEIETEQGGFTMGGCDTGHLRENDLSPSACIRERQGGYGGGGAHQLGGAEEEGEKAGNSDRGHAECAGGIACAHPCKEGAEEGGGCRI